MAMAGNHPKTVQAIMRHSSITLTMDTYGHLCPGQEADAVASLPSMFGSDPEVQTATGTDDGPTSSGAENGARKTAKRDTTGRILTNTVGIDAPQDAAPNVLPLCSLGDDRQHLAKGGGSRPGGSRTPDQGIMSQRQRAGISRQTAISCAGAAQGAALVRS